MRGRFGGQWMRWGVVALLAGAVLLAVLLGAPMHRASPAEPYLQPASSRSPRSPDLVTYGENGKADGEVRNAQIRTVASVGAGDAQSGGNPASKVAAVASPPTKLFLNDEEESQALEEAKWGASAGGSAAEKSLPRILILTPVKNAARHLPRYFANLRGLKYPRHKISIALLEGDSNDSVLKFPNGTVKHVDGPSTMEVLIKELPSLREDFRRVNIYQKDFGLDLPRHLRHEYQYQLPRRSVLAKSRNYLVSKALRDEDWVLWVDADLKGYPEDILQRLLESGKSVVVPNCVMEPGGRSYDLNSWQRPDTGERFEATLEKGEKFEEESHKQKSMGLPWGEQKIECGPKWGDASSVLLVEGYTKNNPNKPLSKLKHQGEVVPLDGVGGAMLLVSAELHRTGLVFPTFPYKQRIETEGLAMMAKDMEHRAWGMPNVEIYHK